jgi:hypothetical protein
MSHILPEKIPQQAFDWYDDYAHGDIERRTFLSRLGSLSVAGLTLGAVTSALTPNYALAEQVSFNDGDIKATYQEFDSPNGHGKGRGYLVVPSKLDGKAPTVLVVHKSQLDIDRWLIGLDQTNTQVAVYEIPTIKGMFPQMFSTVFDNAMREGIPKEIWKGVITVYEDGERVQKYTGNLKPKNARVFLLNAQGEVIHFYDRGFSVNALNALREKLKSALVFLFGLLINPVTFLVMTFEVSCSIIKGLI